MTDQIVVAGKLIDLVNRTAARVSVAVPEAGGAGVPLSLAGGLLYAVGALVVSYAVRAKAAGSGGWTDNWVLGFSVLSWIAMNSGGMCVTFAYQSGASVPFMNAIVCSTNLTMNMVFLMCFRLSVYTKTMRCGTVLFALTALQLGGLSPAPRKVDLHFLGEPQAVSWMHIFLVLWVSSAVLIMRTRSLPGASGVKVMAWALHVACWGSLCDNWAKINGTFDTDSAVYWMLFGPYLAVGGFVMILSVSAMAITDVALYVPAQLCAQLVLNVVCSFLLWGEADSVPSLMPYVVGYMICVLAVYIATPEIDLVASLGKAWGASRNRGEPLAEALLSANARHDAESSPVRDKACLVV